MKLFDVLKLHDVDITPDQAKVHLACWNGREDPLDVFRHGHFERWQASQGARNFERPQIIALVQMGVGSQRWLFAGCYDQSGCEPDPKRSGHWIYTTTERKATATLTGRLIVQYQRQARHSYRKAETIATDLHVTELREKKISVQIFTDFSEVRLTKAELDLIVKNQNDSWVNALSSVRGIYAITDTSNGRLYVGSALAGTRRGGRGGIWQRWCDYSKDGHGGDAELRQVLEQNGAAHVKHFQYSILEIAGSSATVDDVRAREGHWKRVLDTYRHGYNRNLEKDVERQL